MRLKSLILGAVCAVALTSPAFAQSLTAITGGRVLTGTSVIENGTVVIQNGRVVSVGTGAAPVGARIIDARGKVVSPGFVAVDSGQRWLWIFRDPRPPGGWFLHGWFA